MAWGKKAFGSPHHDQYEWLLDKNVDEVYVGGYVALDTGAADMGAGMTQFRACNLGHSTRIRATGTLTAAEFYIKTGGSVDPNDISAFWFGIARRRGKPGAWEQSWDRVSWEDVWALISAIGFDQVAKVTLATPVEVQEGDYVIWGFDANGTGSAAHFMALWIPGETDSMSYIEDYESAATDYNWEETGGDHPHTLITGYATIKTYMTPAPLINMIGTSLASGMISNRSFCEIPASGNDNTHLLSPILNHLMIQMGSDYNGQNMGDSGETSTETEARFDDDVIALKSKLCIIITGGNDIDNCANEAAVPAAKVIYEAKMTSMLDKCTAAGIVAIPCGITPHTSWAGTFKDTARRDWNNTIETLCDSYPEAYFCDIDETLGTGTNYATLNPLYTPDGTHLYPYGYNRWAHKILELIRRR